MVRINYDIGTSDRPRSSPDRLRRILSRRPYELVNACRINSDTMHSPVTGDASPDMRYGEYKGDERHRDEAEAARPVPPNRRHAEAGPMSMPNGATESSVELMSSLWRRERR